MQHDDSNSDLILSILHSLFLLFEPLIVIHELLWGGDEVALKSEYFHFLTAYPTKLELSCLTTKFMGCLPLSGLCLLLADLHHFCLTQRFPKTPSAI